MVGEAGSAERALELAREATASVALVDVSLPDAQDGLHLLRALSGELNVPVVAMSLNSTLRLDALTAGASDFLSKDGSSERLLLALCRVSRLQS